MDNNSMEPSIVCPVCTLYLRPGMTLKSHLGSHPKQKVIEALVRLSGIDDIPKSSCSSTSSQIESTTTSITSATTSDDGVDSSASAAATATAVATPSNSQVSTIQNQTWNQGNLINMPPNIPSIQGNHLFIYQQSMSSTTGPQQNLFNVNPLSPQYLIPTVFNPQMMPYIYQQQQQVIMASGNCVSTRQLPSQDTPTIANTDNNSSDSTNTPEEETSQITNNSDNNNVVVEVNTPEKSDESEVSSSPSSPSQKNKIDKDDIETINVPSNIELKIAEELDYYNQNQDNSDHSNHESDEVLGSPRSQAGSDWSLRVRSDLNKACQTQNMNMSPRSILQDEEYDRPEYYFDEYDERNQSYIPENNYQETSSNKESNLIQTNENLDFVDMEGMHMVMNDFSTNQVISQVENFEGTVPERPGVLMTIGGMQDNSKEDFVDQRDESMSRESSNVNIRADERMPPRGELSGQESIDGASDIVWNRANYENNSAMSTSSYLFVRESWNASDSSDVEVPPLQSRNPPPVNYEPENDDNDTPTIVSITGPPLNFKCSSCDEAFQCLKERQSHEAEKHPEKVRKINRIGGDIVNKKVKKLVVKLKETKPEPENFDNVFTNKLKIETVTENDLNEIQTVEGGDVKKSESIIAADKLKSVCPICECVLENSKALRIHKLQVHNISSKVRHKCMTCNEVFPNDYKFSDHLKIHPLECKLCGKLFYRRQNIQLHMRRHLGIRPHKCDICSKGFLTKQKLEEHRNIHTGDAPIKCTSCDESFRRHSNLVQHRNRHHLRIKKKVKDYICFCTEVFHSERKLAWHKEIHDPKPKSCTQCSEKFIHQSSLTRHMRRAHNEKFLPQGHKSAENVECPICKGVYLKSSLDVHMRNHTGQRPFTCLICNKDFTTKWNLKLHKWTHASRVSKPFKCELCKGAFIRESDYTAHMNSHKSIRPYTCNYCGAQFIRKYNCQRHVKEHENAKTFVCKVCGKAFHRSYYLKDHMRIHSGVRPFSCHICGKTSTTKSNHNKHVQIHHAREPVSTEN